MALGSRDLSLDLLVGVQHDHFGQPSCWSVGQKLLTKPPCWSVGQKFPTNPPVGMSVKSFQPTLRLVCWSEVSNQPFCWSVGQNFPTNPPVGLLVRIFQPTLLLVCLFATVPM